MTAATHPDLNSLLREVSRSFFLTLRILPSAVRSQIGLAYLLARATDTVADTNFVPLADRLDTLARLRNRISGQSTASFDLRKFAQDTNALNETHAGSIPASSGEQKVLLRIDEFFRCLDEMPVPDRDLIRSVLATIISGQELDLRRFGDAGPNKVCALQSDDDLDDYIYRVAGCVGEFWTRICRLRLFPKASIDDASLIGKGIRFGKGLQLVNVLRDLPADLRQGRCYIPRQRLEKAGLAPADLLETRNYTRLQPVYRELLALAERHLEVGWDYTNSLPRRCLRVRLACAWPVLIGARTLAKLRDTNVLDSSHRVKVTRQELRKIMICSIIGHFVPPVWRHLFVKAKLV